MAVDKKSDHYTSASTYRDLDGNMKNFTFIDHDKKSKASGYVPTDETKEDVKQALRDAREEYITRILSYSASFCPTQEQMFTNRGEAKKTIEWNEDALRNQGVPLDRLIRICTLVENKAENR